HPRVDLEEGRAVVVGFSVTGVNKTKVVDVPDQVGEDVARPGARLTVPGEPEGGAHHGPDLVGKEAGVLVETGELLAVELFELRLVVPGAALRLPAVHEEPDHAPRPGGEVGRSRGERVEGDRLRVGRHARGEQALFAEDRRQREEPGPRAGARE